MQMLTISNLLNADCHAVMLVVPSQTSSAFTLSQTQTLFQPREKRLFPIRLTATSEGNVSDQLIVIAYGGEMHRVTLKCRVGSALKLYDTKIDLGPTDIYYGSIGKRILLKNVDDYASLPITLWKSSTDIIVNGGKPLLLDPGEQRRVKIELLSSFTGPRLETVEFYGMNSFPCRLEISAFSGPTLMAPTMEDIIFPSVLAHAESSIVFPVVNLSPFVAQFFIFVPSDSCFALQLLDIEHSHSKRNVAVGTQIIMDSKEHIAGGTSGLIVTIGGKLTANIKVAINQKIPGAYKSTLGVNSIKPKKHPLASFNLCALVLDISLTQQEGAVNKLRKSVAFPANNQDTFIASAPVEKRPPLAYTVFELQPSVLVIRLNPRFVSTNSSQRDDPVDTVTLTNSTSSKQPYHIMLSKPFLTDVPLDGFIEPMTAMEIPIKIVPNYFSTLQPETLNYTCIGGISIYNEDKKFIVVNSAIIGVHSDMMMAEIRSKSDTFDMTPLKSGEKRTQRIYIRNKTPLEVVWEGKLSYFLQKPVGGASDPRESTIGGGAGGGSAGVSGDSIPFALSTPRIGLKPYEVASFDVHFISNIGTQHSARLFMEYTDPNAGKTSSNSSKAVDIVPKKLNLKSLLFQAATGSVDINTTFDSIIFGDLPVGFQSTKVVTVMNPSTIPVTFSIMPSSKEFEMPMWHTIPESSKIDVPIKFISKQPRAYAELITFSCRGVTKSIPLVGYSHRPFEVGSNLGMPTLAKVESPEFETGAAGVGGESRREAEDSNPALNDPATDPALYLPPKQADMIQFGYVGTDKPKPKFFILKNLGSTELTIVGISESSQFKWKFLEEVEDSVLESLIGNTQLKCRELQGAISAKISNDRSNLSMGFTQDVIDLAEIDWDETDLKLREEAVFGNSDPIKPKRTSMTKTKESASLVAKKRRYSRVVRMPSIVASRGKHQSEFPFRLEAFQSLPLVLYFSGTEKVSL